ncbi:MAG: RDD family protein [Maricaulaceae bacterium]
MIIRRVSAFFVDYIVIAIYIGALTAVSVFLGAHQAEFKSGSEAKILWHVVSFVSLTVPVWGYFTLLEGGPGQTLGKRLLRVRVVSLEGGALGRGRAGLRNLMRFLPWELAHTAIWHQPGRPFLDPFPGINLLLCGLSLLAAMILAGSLVLKDNRSLYDRASRSRVVRV